MTLRLLFAHCAKLLLLAIQGELTILLNCWVQMQRLCLPSSHEPRHFLSPQARAVGYGNSGTMQELQVLSTVLSSPQTNASDPGTPTSPNPTLFIGHELAPERQGVDYADRRLTPAR